MKKVTMKDIAREAGVSITTVSKILNNVDMHISEATKERVMELVKAYNYVPNQIAKGLRSKNSNTIGIVTYDIADPYVSQIIVGVESVSKANDISVLICNTNPEKESELEDIQFLTSKMVDGIIFLRCLSAKNEEWVSNLKIPIIVVDREWSMDIHDIGIIDSNSVAAVYKVTELLIKEGCEKIAYIGPFPDKRSSNRIQGYKNALQDNRRALNESLIYQEGFFTPETGIKGVQNIFNGQKIDAVVCANDLIASGALLALNRKGICVPKDVKVTGIDNIALSQYLIPPLTTIDLHGYQVGVECAQMLIARLRDNVALSKKLIECEIVKRESV
ncbi:LacI family DNA-binding transcriptional regulator [Mediterraneibacter sp. NSJ-55]|uniref:LacI family DNA-binding transcriptional regulator n=1 Tax=Mediterraneibacter hominis TaxID=2763054 RepID=A0A923LKP1_9FIRM|nr:LacI family DNA-binding transcriptional regulator [Mediterraneibacter hominis]MBC5690083.1 LacI family DNA-binding transcriptional regulator [Mediterraneibacter hominis]